MKRKNQVMWCGLLCALTVVGMLSGCRKAPATPEPGDTTSVRQTTSAEAETTPPDARDDLDQSYGFDRNYIIFSRESTAYEFASSSQIGGDLVDNAIFSRNLAVEERADVTIQVVKQAGDWQAAGTGDSHGGNREFEGAVRTNAMAGRSVYDLIATHSAYLANLAVEGLGMDMTELADINLTKRWWSEAYYEECNYNGAIYMMIGDLAYTLYDYMEVVFFNETLAAASDIGDLYDLALDGKWTYSLMKEYTGLIDIDLNAEEADRKYGLLTNCHAQRAFANAIEANYLVRQEDGTRIYPETMDETAEKRLSDFVSFVCGTSGVYSPKTWDDAKDSENPIFSSGRALFYMQTLGQAPTLKALMPESELYGVLPFPKWDSDQVEYHTATKDSVTSVMIPCNISDPKSTGVVTELLAMYSNQIVTNAYYEKVLKQQSFDNAKCIETLEMIRLSANLSFQQAFSNCLNNPNSLVSEAIREGGKREISSMYKSDHTTWDIAKLYEDLAKISQASD